jgi:DNA-binding NtrC family response regulator
MDRLPGFQGMVARSKEMLSIFARIEKVGAGDANVCIYGETGTGKELVSRALHNASRRCGHPFITLDCTAVPDALMESHLFGHVRGAFTGAVDQRDGVFTLANQGTLFIDELTELTLALQAKLLRVIQSREFYKVGGSKPLRSNIRLVTAMNKDPKGAVAAGVFREDLYYRVAVVMLRMPPLRERREDIPLLVEHFLRQFSIVYGKPLPRVTGAALERMMHLPWPGNVRQLGNFLEQAFVLAEGSVLTEGDFFPTEVPPSGLLNVLDRLPPAMLPDVARHIGAREDFARIAVSMAAPGSGAVDVFAAPADAGNPASFALSEVERSHIMRTLRAVHGNRTEAARSLGISIRTLQYKLKSYVQTAGNDAPPMPPVR